MIEKRMTFTERDPIKIEFFFPAHVCVTTRDVLESTLTSPPVTTNATAMNNKADHKLNYGTKYH